MVENEYVWLLETLQELMVELEPQTEKHFGDIQSTDTAAKFSMPSSQDPDASLLVLCHAGGISFYFMRNEIVFQGENMLFGLDLIAEILVAVW